METFCSLSGIAALTLFSFVEVDTRSLLFAPLTLSKLTAASHESKGVETCKLPPLAIFHLFSAWDYNKCHLLEKLWCLWDKYLGQMKLFAKLNKRDIEVMECYVGITGMKGEIFRSYLVSIVYKQGQIPLKLNTFNANCLFPITKQILE